MRVKCDFSGWATKNDLKCADGRTIRHNAFKDDDGRTVPLVWQHQHNDVENVLGHALLENRDDGVYAYCTFNNTERGQIAKEQVKNRDITQLSIYANKLKQEGGNVLHGCIREVSLVLAGANPGAMIDFPVLEHSDGNCTTLEDEAMIYTGLDINTDDLNHAEKNEASEENKEVLNNVENKSENTENESQKSVKDVFDSFTEEQKNALYYIVSKVVGTDNTGKEMTHSMNLKDFMSNKNNFEEPKEESEKETKNKPKEKTIKEIIDSLSEEQKKVFYYLVGKAEESKNSKSSAENEKSNDEEAEHSYNNEYDGGNNMKYNVFENEPQELTLSHSDMEDIFANAKRSGSLKASVEAFADVIEHSITDVDKLFPDYKALMDKPELLQREDAWVTTVWNGVHKSPFSRVKSTYVDITADEARAKGYVKGNQKVEEVIKAFKRTTDPQTVYKLQKMDRDDVLDITDFDVVAYLKAEMRIMLNEEIARAILIGDARSAGNDKIDESHIRPVWKDDDIYTIHKDITLPTNPTAYDTCEAIVEAVLRARIDYKGKGTPVAFMDPDTLTTCLLAKDTIGHRLYANVNELATAMRVSKIVECPLFAAAGNREDSSNNKHKLLCLIVNLNDYNVGADKGGDVTMFDDFDIDYNKMSYLIETRISGALINPYTAIAIEQAVTEE